MTDPITRLNAALEGRYRIEREIGEGGMATVYLAHDERHNRNVALKVLKPELAAVVGAERFLAEIETTANLQHPHILPLFDSGEADGFLYFVMPYVKGDTLRDKIDREKQLGVHESVAIVAKVASALDYAHKQGVVHRDIKPGNILLSADGEPTVADFGIALAVAHAGGGRVTETGLSLGTPHYMSPEQATGDRDVDPRTDVYALGSVLYEMLTGDPPYQGSTAQAVLGQIITGRPVSAVEKRATIPKNVDAAIRKSLEKLPADRFDTAQEFARALSDQGFRHGDEAVEVSGIRRGLWNPLSVVSTGVAFVLALGFGWSLLRPEPPRPVVRQVVSAGPAAPLSLTNNYPDVAILPDGQSVVYQIFGDPQPEFAIRRLDELGSTTLQGPEQAFGPFVSPDGRWIGFQAGNGGPLQRVSTLGGPPQTIAALPADLRGASWGPDDTIVFGVNAPGGLWQVPAAGGDPRRLTEADATVQHFFPDVLPTGRGVLFVVNTSPGSTADDGIAVLDLRSGEHRVIIPSGTTPRYASSGHIVYAVGNTLMAVGFDPERLEVTSDPVPMVEAVNVKGNGAASFSLSETGSLAYVLGGAGAGFQRTAVWVDREGREEPLPLPPRFYSNPRVSPDGTRLAVTVVDPDGQQPLWVYDVVSAAGLRLTQEGNASTPVWVSDERIVFSTQTPFLIHSVPTDGSGGPELLLPAEGIFGDFPTSVTPDGRYVIFSRILTAQADHREIFQLPLEGDPVPEALLQGEFNRGNAEVSPDGRWLVYRSDQSGQMEVYLQPYPGPGPTIPVSIGGGFSVTWSPDGSELIYRLDDRMMAVSFDAEGGTPTIGQPRELFRGDYLSLDARQYHVAPDGRFLMLKVTPVQTQSDESAPQVILVQNFFEELRRVVPD